MFGCSCLGILAVGRLELEEHGKAQIGYQLRSLTLPAICLVSGVISGVIGRFVKRVPCSQCLSVIGHHASGRVWEGNCEMEHDWMRQWKQIGLCLIIDLFIMKQVEIDRKETSQRVIKTTFIEQIITALGTQRHKEIQIQHENSRTRISNLNWHRPIIVIW